MTKDEIEIGECGYLMGMKSHFSAVYTHIVLFLNSSSSASAI